MPSRETASRVAEWRVRSAADTTKEIAEALFISEQTVKTHVSRVLTKLDLRDRAQMVIAAYESGLV